MGDNTALYGDRQTMILVAVAFGYLYAMRSPVSVSEETQGTERASTIARATHHGRHTPAHKNPAGRRASSIVRRPPSRRLQGRVDVARLDSGGPSSRRDAKTCVVQGHQQERR